jgi:hypothetical protein
VLTNIMKWIAIVALFLAVLWRSSADYRTILQFVVCAGATFVVLQAARSGKYLWAAAFSGIAVLFNPIVPVELSRGMFLWLDLTCLAMFLVSLASLKTRTRLSVVSITDPTPQSESL